eukprot:2465740-Pyramimonas_sp.AAC.1
MSGRMATPPSLPGSSAFSTCSSGIFQSAKTTQGSVRDLTGRRHRCPLSASAARHSPCKTGGSWPR